MAKAGSIRSFTDKVIDVLRRWAHRLHNCTIVFKPCRFSILIVLAAAFVMWRVDQGNDLLRDLAERTSGNVDNWLRFFFITGVLVWAIFSWYWSRIMLFLRFPGVPGNEKRLLKVRTWLPRIIGFAAMMSVAAALFKASSGYDTPKDAARILLLVYAWAMFIGAFVFLYVVSKRRKWMLNAYERLQKVRALQGQIASPLVGLLKTRQAADLDYGIRNFQDLPPSVQSVAGATLFCVVLLFLLFSFAIHQTAPLIGTAAILLFAAAGWIAFGSLLDFIGMRSRFPMVIFLLLIATIFSFWNDNHAVRTLPISPVPREARMELNDALQAWYKHQLKRPSPDGKYPLFIVAAEGGGSRAAYWTAAVLSKITDDNPSFPDQLFALSSVSGGSLGTAVYLAQLADAPVAPDGFRCLNNGGHLPLDKEPGEARTFKDVSKSVLGEDFLSPAIAALLYPDLVQRFLPLPVESFDRARALEGAWERAWSKHAGNDRLSRLFDDLWPGKGEAWMPVLFLNSTWVEKGKRLIVSHLRLTAEDFNDAEDINSFYTGQSLPLSTAVHLSARFTYISPAGSLKKDGIIYGRAVDGGYFENSGETTVIEILKTIDVLADKDPGWEQVRPIVIHISNEPVNPDVVDVSLSTPTKKRDKASRPQAYLNETLSPPITLLNTRAARGVYAREAVRWHVTDDNFLHFGLCKKTMEVPLGWALSDAVQKEMDKQLTTKCEGINGPVVFDNPGNLKTISEILKKRY